MPKRRLSGGIKGGHRGRLGGPRGSRGIRRFSLRIKYPKNVPNIKCNCNWEAKGELQGQRRNMIYRKKKRVSAPTLHGKKKIMKIVTKIRLRNGEEE